MGMHTELWFPSVVWSSVIHIVENTSLKHFVYDRQRNDIGKTSNLYNGYQSSDLLPGDNENIDKLITLLDKEVNNCARQVGLPQLELNNINININPPGSYLKPTTVNGSIVSGFYFIDATEMQGNLQFDRTDGANNYLPEYVEQETYFTCSTANYATKTNALYFFPSWLTHSIQGNRSHTDRIFLSFNYGEIK